MNQSVSSNGLPAATLRQLCAVLEAHPVVEKATLFGSRAQGRHKPGSDIDLALDGEALSDRELGRIADEIDDLLLPYTLDLCRIADIDNPDLLAHIRNVGQTIYLRTA